jgi:hypothetical protein
LEVLIGRLVEFLLIVKWVVLLLQADLCFLDQVVALFG